MVKITDHEAKESLAINAKIEGVPPMLAPGGQLLMSVEGIHIRYVNAGDGWGVDVVFVSGKFVNEDGTLSIQRAGRSAEQRFYETRWPEWLEAFVRDQMPDPGASIVRQPSEVPA